MTKHCKHLELDSRAPYGNLNPSEKTLLDKVLSWIFPYMIPLANLAKHSSYTDDSINSKKMKEVIGKLREKMKKMDEGEEKSKLEEWDAFIREKESAGFLITGTVTIPQNNEVLSIVGLLDVDKELDQHLSSTKPEDCGPGVKLVLTCPSSAIEKACEVVDSPSSGMKSFKECKLDTIKFVSSVQVILWFHGGGLVLGGAKDSIALESAKELSKIVCEGGDNHHASSLPHIVLLLVDYWLAPKNPFPAAGIDCLTASSFVTKHYPSLVLHVAGISAGGNLAAVVGLETQRNYHDKQQLKSIVANIPMICPSCTNSSSYKLNSKLSESCPVDFKRWCWSAYLQLDEKKENNINFCSSQGLIDALERSMWSRCVNVSSDSSEIDDTDSLIWRLVCPLQGDLPGIIDNTPKTIVLTASADPLREEGVEFVRFLERKYGENTDKVAHFECRGIYTDKYKKMPILGNIKPTEYGTMTMKSKTQLSYSEYVKELQSFAVRVETKSSDNSAEKQNMITTTTGEEQKSKDKININHIEGLPLNEKGYVPYEGGKYLTAEEKTKVLEKRQAILEDKSREFTRHPKYKDRPDPSKGRKGSTIHSIKSLNMHDTVIAKAIQYLEKHCKALNSPKFHRLCKGILF